MIQRDDLRIISEKGPNYMIRVLGIIKPNREEKNGDSTVLSTIIAEDIETGEIFRIPRRMKGARYTPGRLYNVKWNKLYKRYRFCKL